MDGHNNLSGLDINNENLSSNVNCDRSNHGIRVRQGQHNTIAANYPLIRKKKSPFSS